MKTGVLFAVLAAAPAAMASTASFYNNKRCTGSDRSAPVDIAASGCQNGDMQSMWIDGQAPYESTQNIPGCFYAYTQPNCAGDKKWYQFQQKDICYEVPHGKYNQQPQHKWASYKFEPKACPVSAKTESILYSSCVIPHDGNQLQNGGQCMVYDV